MNGLALSGPCFFLLPRFAYLRPLLPCPLLLLSSFLSLSVICFLISSLYISLPNTHATPSPFS
jgi:hypothetical protein